MIFPELPKRYNLTLEPPSVQTPLRGIEVQEETQKVNVEEWFIKHGLAGDPAAGKYTPRTKEPINWLARDAGEFYLLCVVMTVWIVYWYGSHRGWW